MSEAFIKTSGFEQSIIEALIFPKFGISKISTGLFVGNNPYPRVPEGLIIFSFIGAAEPGTPAIEKFPEYSTFSSGV